MKEFTKAEIDGMRKYCQNHNFPEVKVNLGNRRFSYYVVPQSQEPNLPDFVTRCTGDTADGYVLGISNSVNESYRQYAVAHEFI